jgi:hypothetical protein
MMGRRSQKKRAGPKRGQQSKPSSVVIAPVMPEAVMERYGSMRELDRSFDIEYWQRQGDAAIFRAAWELVESYWRALGRDPDELRLQRSVETFQKL